jgi:hypothetical protein
MVHEILGIRALPRFPAGGRSPTIACGMIGTWPGRVKKGFAAVRVSTRSERLEPAGRKTFGLPPASEPDSLGLDPKPSMDPRVKPAGDEGE